MTLIYERVGSDNHRVCDAKCYDAKHTDCHCVCGGLNHGRGLRSATQRTYAFAGSILEEYGKMQKPEGARLDFAWDRIRKNLSGELLFGDVPAGA